MNRVVRLWLLIAFCLAWPAASHAQDRAQITRQIAGALTEIALIERERARPDVADDFAAFMLTTNRQRLAEGYAQADRSGQGRAIRQDAQRTANRIIGATPRTDYLRYYPDPVRVRADIDADAGATGVEREGRKAGRLLMLESSLAGLQGNNWQAEERWPPDVAQRARIYRLHFYDIHDYEGFASIRINEYDSFERVAELATFIAEHGALGAELIDHFCGDLEEARGALEDRHLGQYASVADYVQDITEETTAIPHTLRHYIDWQAMARDCELNGDLFTIQTAHDAVHVFAGC